VFLGAGSELSRRCEACYKRAMQRLTSTTTTTY
jgi:hypothetical protein